MTTTPLASNPHFAVAGELVEALAGRNFEGLAATLEPDAMMSTLLPRGFVEWQGAEEICGAFGMWFGDVDTFEISDAEVGHVGDLMQIRWRVRVRGGPRFPEPMVIEQCVYASTTGNARINQIRLLCSGFRAEHRERNQA
jgi:SnoaL-like protein